MRVVSFIAVFSSCCIGWALCAHGGSESSSTVSITVPTTPPCAMPQESLYELLNEILLDGLDLYINCLSFGRNSALVSGVISGINSSDPSTGSERVELTCVGGGISGRPSALPPSMTNMSTSGCLSCMNVAQGDQICQGPCQSPCERCFNSNTTCSRCTACRAEPTECLLEGEGTSGLAHCADTCQETLEVEHDRFNACECPSGYYRELNNPQPAASSEEGEVETTCHAPELEDFRCVKTCNVGNNKSEILNTCFACGLPYCLQCNRTTRECNQCLSETVLFDHECFACPLSLVAEVAIEQEEELEEEEREARKHQLELAISLPILCVAVALFFFFMSLFAHYRYPHISAKGHKRHRVLPDDFAQSVDLSDQEFDSAPSSVWRARPTVRLR